MTATEPEDEEEDDDCDPPPARGAPEAEGTAEGLERACPGPTSGADAVMAVGSILAALAAAVMKAEKKAGVGGIADPGPGTAVEFSGAP